MVFNSIPDHIKNNNFKIFKSKVKRFINETPRAGWDGIVQLDMSIWFISYILHLYGVIVVLFLKWLIVVMVITIFICTMCCLWQLFWNRDILWWLMCFKLIVLLKFFFVILLFCNAQLILFIFFKCATYFVILILCWIFFILK